MIVTIDVSKLNQQSLDHLASLVAAEIKEAFSIEKIEVHIKEE